MELSFGDKDHVPNAGDYTLFEGDFVNFRIAGDKRLKNSKSSKQRATQLSLIDGFSLRENAVNTNEHRENGILSELVYDENSTLPIGGLIRCLERDDLVYFSMAELIRYVTFVPPKDESSQVEIFLFSHLFDSTIFIFIIFRCSFYN